MLRIFLLIIVGFFFALASLRVLVVTIALVADLRKNAAHTPEILGILCGTLVIALALGWLLRKIYHQRPPRL